MRVDVRPVAGLVVTASLVLVGCETTGPSRLAEQLSTQSQKDAQAREVAYAAGQTVAEAQDARDREKAARAETLTREAINQYREALALSPNMPEVWNNLGVELIRVQDYLGASQAFQNAMQQSPTDPRPPENLAVVYHLTGWDEQALEYFDMALERSPNYLPALRGAIKTSHLLGEADQRRLDQVRRALMLETDPEFREFFEREQVRILGRLEQGDRRRPSRQG